MTYNISRAFCAVLAAAMLTGCASGGSVESGVSIADFGSSGGVDYSGSTPQETGETTTAATTKKYSPPAAQDIPRDTSEAPAETTEGPAAAQTEATTRSTPAEEQDGSTEKPQATASTTQSTTADTAANTSVTTTTNTTTTQPQVAEPTTDYDFGSSHYTALNFSEVKGVWISYIELAEILTGQTRESFRSNIGEVFDNCAELGINTVYVHVRSHGDAYYRSELFPWSKYVTGTLGTDPGFDPLDIMLTEAHDRGLSFHAWINPLRTCSTSQLASYGSYPVYSFATGTGTAGRYAVDVSGTYYLNPAYDEVTQLIAAGAAEIVANYDVDGLHIDDYFYPTTESYFDSSAYSASGYDSLSEFRLANCDRLVSELYSAVKSANPTALFSVSVQGSISNNYDQMYADVRKWCTQPGFLDVMIPQIYYGFENSAAPYQATLDEWDSLASAGGIPLVAGLSVSKVGCEDKWAGSGRYEWINSSDIISRQTAAAKKCSSYGGIALYSYRSIFQPEQLVSAAVSKEISALKELI
ncbi:MAG: glycoside hydrolase family 10 protein [Oscillospiraceae bacterium]